MSKTAKQRKKGGKRPSAGNTERRWKGMNKKLKAKRGPGTGSSRQIRGGAAARRWFPGLRRADGCAAVVMVAERAGGVWEDRKGIFEVKVMESSGSERRMGGRLTRIPARTCRALGAFGHPQRVRILAKLVEGPATYRALQRVTKLKAGPLYHHINQLRLAGLLLPKERDVYELTRGGRNLVLTAVAMGPLVRDVRRRPYSGGK